MDNSVVNEIAKTDSSNEFATVRIGQTVSDQFGNMQTSVTERKFYKIYSEDKIQQTVSAKLLDEIRGGW